MIFYFFFNRKCVTHANFSEIIHPTVLFDYIRNNYKLNRTMKENICKRLQIFSSRLPLNNKISTKTAINWENPVANKLL